jgi:hypothetical protein
MLALFFIYLIFFKKKLFEEYSIMKKYEDITKLLLVYNKFGIPINKTDFEQDCRSLVIDMENLQIISYTCPNPISNREAQQFLLNNNDLELEMYKCYEGSILSLFNHKNKWHLATRRCLDAFNSKWNQTNYFNMFMDVLNKENMTFNNFTANLDPNNGYYFIIIHNKNKNIVELIYY